MYRIPRKSATLNKNIVYLVTDKKKNSVGTLRVIDERYGKIELANFREISDILENFERPCAEATRFTVPNRHPDSITIKLLLWKAFYLYCRAENVKTMLISSRPIYARNYTFLGFEDVGECGHYHHPHLKNKLHKTYKLHLPRAEEFWYGTNHPLLDFFEKYQHNINI